MKLSIPPASHLIFAALAGAHAVILIIVWPLFAYRFDHIGETYFWRVKISTLIGTLGWLCFSRVQGSRRLLARAGLLFICCLLLSALLFPRLA